MFIQSPAPSSPALVSTPHKHLVAALSHARLSSYRRFFATTTDVEAIGLYRWNEELSVQIFRLVSLIEVVLRNQFHAALSKRYGGVGSGTSRDWYNFLNLSAKSFSAIQKVTHRKSHGVYLPRNPAPSPDDVVSKVTFGFWPRLFDVTKDTVGVAIPWADIIVELVPGHRQKALAYWQKQARQDKLYARFDLCNEMRNRIAHLEPIWKQGELPEEKRPRFGILPKVVAPAPATPKEAVARLELIYGRMTELLGWLSPGVLASYSGGTVDEHCVSLISEASLNHYREQRPLASFDLQGVRGSRKIIRLLKYAARNKQPLRLVHGKQKLGLITCARR